MSDQERTVIDQLLDELQSAGVFATALLNNVHDFNYCKEKARPVIAKYLTPSVALDKLDSSSPVGWYECEMRGGEIVSRWWDGSVNLWYEKNKRSSPCDLNAYRNFRRLVPADSSGWQPIESAPLNQSVLVFIPNAEHYGPGIYRAIRVNMRTDCGWQTTGWMTGRDLPSDTQPTHWRPLPAPPQEQGT